MKVLVHNRNPDLWVGGDAVQVRETIRALKKLDIEVEFTSNSGYPLDSFNLVHVFHINFFWTKDIYPRLRNAKVPYIISAIFFPQEFHCSFTEMRQFVDDSRATIALSTAEKREMVEKLGCDPHKIVVIPNGVDHTLFYREEKGKPQDRIISIGRLMATKGPHLLIKACQKLHIPLYYISSGEDNSEYAKECRKYITGYYRNISQFEVAQLLRESRVYVCPSLTERQSLGVLEAAACGCPIVDSIHNRGNDLLSASKVVDPEDTEALCDAIQKQWATKRNTNPVPTWDGVAEEIKELYYEVL